MKSLLTVAPLLVIGTLLNCCVPCFSDATNPIQKVLELLSSLEQEIIKDAAVGHKGYVEFSNMCEDRSRDLSNEIKLSHSQVDDLKATIDKATDDESETTTAIEELSALLSNSEADLKAATNIRQKETADFAIDQKDLIDTISQMERAISIIEKPIALAQLPQSAQQAQQQRAAALAAVFSTMIDSSSLDSADTERLSSLIQSSEGDSDGESAAELDEAEESYTGRRPENAGSIVETLENLLEKAQTQLYNARTKETKSRYNYELFKASLQRKIAQAQKDMADGKKALGEAGQTRAEAQGSVEVTKKDLAEDQHALNTLHHECMTKAQDYEEETQSRGEEIKALAAAKKVIKEMTGAAEDETYGKFAQVDSFLQKASSTAQAPSTVRVVRAVRALAKKQKMPALIEMVHKMESIVRNSAISGEDPFAKVKTLLTFMLDTLQRTMQAEASHKVYCDKEMSDTKKSKAVKESLVDKLSTRIDTQNSESMQLRDQVAVLQKELLAIMETQRKMDHMRKEENALYTHVKPELEMGQDGIKKSLQVLRVYYSKDEEKGHEAKEGAGTTIISMLEVVESDFAKGIANLEEQEEAGQAQYLEQTEENHLAQAIKEQDVVFKTKKIKSLGKSTSESSTDLDGVQTELDAVNDYYAKIQEGCVAKPVPYEERRKRQETTLQGLQDAMQILEGKALLQQSSRRLRGVEPHHPSATRSQSEPAEGSEQEVDDP